MPESYGEQAKVEPLYRVVCDYIAGMTDQYLLRLHGELLRPAGAGKAAT
jgi:dGTP triphosphohydrolase